MEGSSGVEKICYHTVIDSCYDRQHNPESSLKLGSQAWAATNHYMKLLLKCMEMLLGCMVMNIVDVVKVSVDVTEVRVDTADNVWKAI